MSRHLLSPLVLTTLALVLTVPTPAEEAVTAPATPAETTSAGTAARTLTLDQALALGAERNRDIAKAQEYQRSVKGRYIEERAGALPHLSLNAGYTKSDDKTQAAMFGDMEMGDFKFSIPTDRKVKNAEVGLDQALFTWGQVGAAIRAAKVGLATGEDQINLARQAMVRDVTAAFHDVLLTKELAAIAHENLSQKQRHLDEAKRKFTAGTATDYDVLAAEVAVENARPEAIRADNGIQSAKDRLRYLLALDNEEIDASGSLATAVAAFPLYPESLSTALLNRPDLADQQHRREVYKELVKIAKAGDKPRLDLKANYGRQQLETGPGKATGTVWSAGVYLSFPFFDGFKTRGKIRQALSDYNTAEISEAKLRDEIGLQVRDAVNAVKESGEIVKALSGTVTQAERLLYMAEKGFELGVMRRLDVQDAQLNLMSAKANLARAQRDYLVAQTNLKFATGTIR